MHPTAGDSGATPSSAAGDVESARRVPVVLPQPVRLIGTHVQLVTDGWREGHVPVSFRDHRIMGALVTQVDAEAPLVFRFDLDGPAWQFAVGAPTQRSVAPFHWRTPVAVDGDPAVTDLFGDVPVPRVETGPAAPHATSGQEPSDAAAAASDQGAAPRLPSLPLSGRLGQAWAASRAAVRIRRVARDAARTADRQEAGDGPDQHRQQPAEAPRPDRASGTPATPPSEPAAAYARATTAARPAPVRRPAPAPGPGAGTDPAPGSAHGEPARTAWPSGTSAGAQDGTARGMAEDPSTAPPVARRSTRPAPAATPPVNSAAATAGQTTPATGVPTEHVPAERGAAAERYGTGEPRPAPAGPGTRPAGAASVPAAGAPGTPPPFPERSAARVSAPPKPSEPEAAEPAAARVVPTVVPAGESRRTAPDGRESAASEPQAPQARTVGTVAADPRAPLAPEVPDAPSQGPLTPPVPEAVLAPAPAPAPAPASAPVGQSAPYPGAEEVSAETADHGHPRGLRSFRWLSLTGTAVRRRLRGATHRAAEDTASPHTPTRATTEPSSVVGAQQDTGADTGTGTAPGGVSDPTSVDDQAPRSGVPSQGRPPRTTLDSTVAPVTASTTDSSVPEPAPDGGVPAAVREDVTPLASAGAPVSAAGAEPERLSGAGTDLSTPVDDTTPARTPDRTPDRIAADPAPQAAPRATLRVRTGVEADPRSPVPGPVVPRRAETRTADTPAPSPRPAPRAERHAETPLRADLPGDAPRTTSPTTAPEPQQDRKPEPGIRTAAADGPMTAERPVAADAPSTPGTGSTPHRTPGPRTAMAHGPRTERPTTAGWTLRPATTDNPSTPGPGPRPDRTPEPRTATAAKRPVTPGPTLRPATTDDSSASRAVTKPAPHRSGDAPATAAAVTGETVTRAAQAYDGPAPEHGTSGPARAAAEEEQPWARDPYDSRDARTPPPAAGASPAPLAATTPDGHPVVLGAAEPAERSALPAPRRRGAAASLPAEPTERTAGERGHASSAPPVRDAAVPAARGEAGAAPAAPHRPVSAKGNASRSREGGATSRTEQARARGDDAPRSRSAATSDRPARPGTAPDAGAPARPGGHGAAEVPEGSAPTGHETRDRASAEGDAGDRSTGTATTTDRSDPSDRPEHPHLASAPAPAPKAKAKVKAKPDTPPRERSGTGAGTGPSGQRGRASAAPNTGTGTGTGTSEAAPLRFTATSAPTSAPTRAATHDFRAHRPTGTTAAVPAHVPRRDLPRHATGTLVPARGATHADAPAPFRGPAVRFRVPPVTGEALPHSWALTPLAPPGHPGPPRPLLEPGTAASPGAGTEAAHPVTRPAVDPVPEVPDGQAPFRQVTGTGAARPPRPPSRSADGQAVFEPIAGPCPSWWPRSTGGHAVFRPIAPPAPQEPSYGVGGDGSASGTPASAQAGTSLEWGIPPGITSFEEET
ncbi:hypothetical protein ACFXKW_00880 [Streptomyces sp. NPDC059193]|uniref:hypothetical protein n=1 Tax=Streptomyces sp. NPDC059193 TaxID=3346763 RepID=UPI0036ACE523